jgi:hypothetical protein
LGFLLCRHLVGGCAALSACKSIILYVTIFDGSLVFIKSMQTCDLRPRSQNFFNNYSGNWRAVFMAVFVSSSLSLGSEQFIPGVPISWTSCAALHHETACTLVILKLHFEEILINVSAIGVSHAEN